MRRNNGAPGGLTDRGQNLLRREWHSVVLTVGVAVLVPVFAISVLALPPSAVERIAGPVLGSTLMGAQLPALDSPRQRTSADYELSYRHVKLREANEEWFAAARFRLPRGDGAKSRATIKELLERRIAAQPLNLPNAGSVFRNPPNDYAARLIEACGLKGRVEGGAMISDKHANFIVNTGGARAADIETLIELAQSSVKEKFNIDLEREVRIVGEPA